ncbi:MAG: hypothetical protein HN458_04350 [Euryarchaeota archaeon]|jgi:hypothetical protein|nr:hypothetical protein [Euryarchaeota archaeon]
MDVRKMRTFGWTQVELTRRPSRVLYPIAWGLLPLGFAFMCWLFGASQEYIPWLGAASMLLMLMGGLAGVSSRFGTLNASKVGVGLVSICFGVMVWALVAQETVSVVFGLVYSGISVYVLVKALDFIFRDSGYVFEREWDAKQKLPSQALHDWDIKTTRFSQTCMALKRFNGNCFVQIYGVVRDGKSYLRFDLLGCQSKLEFKALNFGVEWPDFQAITLGQEE